MPRFSLTALAVAALLGLSACAGGVAPTDNFTDTTLLTADSRQALTSRIKDFDREISRSNMQAIVNFLPPKLIALKAEEAGASPEFVKAAIATMMKGVLGDMKFTGRSDLSQALVGTAGNGQPYAIIPTVAQVELGGEKMTQQGLTLALLDGGQWYLVGLTEQNIVDDVKAAYPEFSSVNLPFK